NVKLVSVYRDTYLDNTNGEYRKATECFAGGGAERSVNMLNKNLDLDIKDFVTVDFNAIIEAVDLLGGIDLDITEEERNWLNGYLVETSQVTGVPYTTIDYAGTHHVTGIQAMAYCRIRYTEGWDFKRTERQRIVLEKIFAAAQAQGVTSLLSMVDTMIPYISTSLSNTEIIALATGIAKYSIEDTTGFPFNQQAANIAAGDCVVPVNLAANVTQLHEYLFGETGYTPSDTVQEISNKIISDTGIQ
ncbi:MAG: LCP family protein, partial [Candidatus Choladocola sp.]|nr:LCP family protein [Candidatus Choladocola sp.]